MSDVAKPMIWLYLRTAAPAAMADVATLCPAGICAALFTPSPGIAVPGRMSARATTTLSAGLRRMASVGMAGLSGRRTGWRAVGHYIRRRWESNLGGPRAYPIRRGGRPQVLVRGNPHLDPRKAPALYANALRRGLREIDQPAVAGAAIVDADRHRAAVLGVGDQQLRLERQRGVCRRQLAAIEGLAARRPPSLEGAAIP